MLKHYMVVKKLKQEEGKFENLLSRPWFVSDDVEDEEADYKIEN